MNAPAETPGSTPAKILYRPFGLISSIVAGLLASLIFKRYGRGQHPETITVRRNHSRANTRSRKS